ncbi:MAG: MFS transporter, partial [Flavobacteriales bacterium]
MLGVEAIPAVIYSVMVLQVPNSPRWLVLNKKDEVGALKMLTYISDKAQALIKLEEIKNSIGVKTTKEGLFAGKYKKPLMLAFLIAFFNQLSGINFVLYYAPEILERAGLGGKESLFNSISIGIINLIFTLIGIQLIDRLGRKQLMKIGSFGYIISLSMVGWCFYTGASSTLLLIFI